MRGKVIEKRGNGGGVKVGEVGEVSPLRYRPQTVGGVIVLRTMHEFIIYFFTWNPMECSRRFHGLPWPSMTFHGVLWGKFSVILELSITFHNIP